MNYFVVKTGENFFVLVVFALLVLWSFAGLRHIQEFGVPREDGIVQVRVPTGYSIGEDVLDKDLGGVGRIALGAELGDLGQGCTGDEIIWPSHESETDALLQLRQ